MTPNRILIIKPSSLGDVATTLPMLCDLRRACPDAVIDWLIAPAFASLIQGHDALNEVLLFERNALAAWWRSPSAFKKFVALNRRLRSARYDCVIDAQGLLRSGFFSRITGAKVRIGFADAREGGSHFYTHKIPIRRRDAMSVVRMRALLDPLGIPHENLPEYRVPIDPQARAKIVALLPSDAVGFIPGCRGEGKRWAADAFAAVISRLALKQPIILFGAPDERALCDEILARSGTAGANRINLAGQTSIAEMTAALAHCRLVIGNDTGPLHVAVALGRTILGLYGRTDPASVGPYGQLENVVRFVPDAPWQATADEVAARAESHLTTHSVPAQETACPR
jgi:lipopolysaccharide heptosyltransferase I